MDKSETQDKVKCSSPICIMQKDGTRGRMFTPTEGVGKVWCPDCIKVSNELSFFAGQTAKMIRETYQGYIETNLPKEVKLFLEQFTRELLSKLSEEL